MSLHFAETKYGFDYGAAKVTRCCSDEKKGWVVIRVETPRMGLEIYVTKTGKVRVYDYDKKLELLPPVKKKGNRNE